jgi:hypothetical protein
MCEWSSASKAGLQGAGKKKESAWLPWRVGGSETKTGPGPDLNFSIFFCGVFEPPLTPRNAQNVTKKNRQKIGFVFLLILV